MLRLIFILGLCCVGSSVSEWIHCHACQNGISKCNDTICELTSCATVEMCDGSCMLVVKIRDEMYRSSIAMCLHGKLTIPPEDIFDERDRGTSCKQSRPPMYSKESNDTTIMCMCQHDYCNSNMILSPPEENPTEENPTENPAKDNEDATNELTYVIIAVLTCVVAVSAALALFICRRKAHVRKEKQMLEKSTRERFSSDSCILLDGGWDESGKHSCSTYKYSTSLGSQYSRGYKGNALNQNDQHLPIELEKIIGRGRYAEVWKAKLQQENESAKAISVKVFRLPNYGAWRQEKEILSEKWMKHENIIEYYTSEQHSTRGLQYWLITDYYSKGNLQEFLINNTLKWNEFCDMAASLAQGLAYLHSEQDNEGHEKLPVAHRDIKSCNILVKDDGFTCVLADFGLSLKLDPTLTQDELANAGQVGTSRYMAPELLERLVNLADIEMFKRVDMYAFALVMWELATRCEVFPGMVQPYQPPYGDLIPDHPTKEQILLHVCRAKQRPEIRREWENHSGFAKFVATMTECWDTEPEARLTASCVHERILELRNEETVLDLPLSPKEEALDKGSRVHNDITQLTELISTVV